MAVTARRLLTNFSKGELSPNIEGRPDLVAYFEGGRQIENFFIMRQGGLERRWGTRFIGEIGRISAGAVVDTADFASLLPFEASVNDAFIVNMFRQTSGGTSFMYFYKNKARIDSTPGTPVVLAIGYDATKFGEIHFTQSVDVMYMFHETVRQRKLSRFSDQVWSHDEIFYDPPPTFEQDIALSSYVPGGNTITFSASTGSVNVTCTTSIWLAADVDRILVLRSQTAARANSRLKITSITSGTVAVATVLDGPVTSGVGYPVAEVSFRLSPQVALDPDKKAPVNSTVTLVTGGLTNAFRSQDVGRYIKIYVGIVEITGFTSATTVTGRLVREMTGASAADPPAAPAGSWSLETPSWGSLNGFPGTGEFHGGRLGQARTPVQPTTFWLSGPDDYENYGVGTNPDDAVEYTIASRKLNRIEWVADNKDFFLGTSGSEHRAEGGRSDEPIGGDVLPRVRQTTAEGSAGIQPAVIGRRIIFVDRSRRKLFTHVFDVEADEFDSVELTGASDHIMGTGVKVTPVGVQRRLDPRLFYVTEDGVLVVLTYSWREKVIGFSRIVTDGKFKAVAVIPDPVNDNTRPRNDQVWVVVERTINGSPLLYLEVFEDSHASITNRPWKSLQTDSAVVKTGVTGTSVTGLGHLNGKSVDVVVNGVYRGQKTVTAGAVTLDEAVTNAEVEVGLHYRSLAETFRPGIEGQVIEGLPRWWTTLWARLRLTLGGKVNGEKIQYEPQGSTQALFSGDRKVNTGGVTLDGSITIEQDEPYPMQLLAVFGKLQVGDTDG